MFNNLSNKISQSIRNILGSGRLTENNIKSTLSTIRIALLDADVSVSVVQDFINQIKGNVIGQSINKHLTPGQEFIRIIHSALIKVIGSGNNEVNLEEKKITKILMIGAQGSGKTTTTGKLAKFLRDKKKKKVLVSSTDIYRPAGIQQLKKLVDSEHIDFFSIRSFSNAIDIVAGAMEYAQSQYYDVLLVDSAGCLDTEDVLLSELVELHRFINPIETLLVIDAMIGQVAINNIKIYNKFMPITGIILTKLDGSSKGGVALSIKYLTGYPIKFMGTGEKIDDLEVFYPNRIASRILGMGDVLSLIDKIDCQFKKKVSKKYVKNNKLDFNLYDFMEYINQIQNMGGVNNIVSKLPNLGMNLDVMKIREDGNFFIRIESIINSMTKQERMYPDIITKSRKNRIAAGAGVDIQSINKFLTQFNYIRIMMRQMHKNGMSQMARKLRSKIKSGFTLRYKE